MINFENQKEYLLALHYHQINLASYQYYESLRDFNQRYEQLKKELQKVKQEFKEVKQELQSVKERLVTPPQSLNQKTASDKSKTHQKGFHCPFNTCDRKYGSRIALRTHLRLKHEGKQGESNESMSEYVDY